MYLKKMTEAHIRSFPEPPRVSNPTDLCADSPPFLCFCLSGFDISRISGVSIKDDRTHRTVISLASTAAAGVRARKERERPSEGKGRTLRRRLRGGFADELASPSP